MDSKARTVLFMRHLRADGAGINLATGEIERGVKIGQALRRRGLFTSCTLTSPEPRAVKTILAAVHGTCPTHKIEPAFGSVRKHVITFTEEEISDIQATAKAAGRSVEQELLLSEKYAEKVSARAKCAFVAIAKTLSEETDDVILIVSHGGLIEATVALYVDWPINVMEAMSYGDVWYLRFDNSGELLEAVMLEYQQEKDDFAVHALGASGG